MIYVCWRFNDSKRGGYWRLALCICRSRAQRLDMVSVGAASAFMQNPMQSFPAAALL